MQQDNGPATVYAVCEGDQEMFYGYPPNIHALFATEQLAQDAVTAWTQQANATRDAALAAGKPSYDAPRVFEPLFIVPIPVQTSIPATPVPGSMGVGHAEWLALHEQGKA
jgi:hypothetical protein